mgnify:CR=1 FL=1
MMIFLVMKMFHFTYGKINIFFQIRNDIVIMYFAIMRISSIAR